MSLHMGRIFPSFLTFLFHSAFFFFLLFFRGCCRGYHPVYSSTVFLFSLNSVFNVYYYKHLRFFQDHVPCQLNHEYVAYFLRVCGSISQKIHLSKLLTSIPLQPGQNMRFSTHDICNPCFFPYVYTSFNPFHLITCANSDHKYTFHAYP